MTKITAKIKKNTNKLSRSERIVEANTKKVGRLLGRFPKPEYDLHIEFDLIDGQDINDPTDWLYKGDSELERTEMGSGYSFINGMRDFHWRGSEQEMQKIMRRFSNSPFRIGHIYIYPCDWPEGERGVKCLTTKPGWNSATKKKTKK